MCLERSGPEVQGGASILGFSIPRYRYSKHHHPRYDGGGHLHREEEGLSLEIVLLLPKHQEVVPRNYLRLMIRGYELLQVCHVPLEGGVRGRVRLPDLWKEPKSGQRNGESPPHFPCPIFSPLAFSSLLAVLLSHKISPSHIIPQIFRLPSERLLLPAPATINTMNSSTSGPSKIKGQKQGLKSHKSEAAPAPLCRGGEVPGGGAQ